MRHLLAALLALQAGLAIAEPRDEYPSRGSSLASDDVLVLEPPRPDDPSWLVGRVLYTNLVTSGLNYEERVLELDGLGKVGLSVSRVPENWASGDCADTLTVRSLPQGVWADPEVVTLPENETTVVVLWLFVGT